jgi:hypothetical protein
MAVEDTFNGAMSALTFMRAYANMVAQKIGAEEALSLETETCETMGAMQGMMIKEQMGGNDISLSEASQVLRNQIESGYGITSELVEESDSKITSKAGRCPVFEAAQLMGMDVKDIEANCRATSMRFMDAMVKQLNPNLSYELTKFRSTADESCEESLVLT